MRLCPVLSHGIQKRLEKSNKWDTMSPHILNDMRWIRSNSCPDEGEPAEMNRILAICMLILLAGSASNLLSSAAAEEPFVPWDYTMPPPKGEVKAGKEEISPAAAALLGGVRFYQRFISPVKGERCPMTPSCSAYAVEAIRKHGFFVGYMMTADRLIHEGDEKRYTRAIVSGNKVRFFDPVSNNDFWFTKDSNP
jgi:putative membrane protein insertion efficiency factor